MTQAFRKGSMQALFWLKIFEHNQIFSEHEFEILGLYVLVYVWPELILWYLKN